MLQEPPCLEGPPALCPCRTERGHPLVVCGPDLLHVSGQLQIQTLMALTYAGATSDGLETATEDHT